MDTETKAPTKLAAIRTYAKDLDSNRNHKASAAAEPVVVETAEQMVKEPVRASDTLTTKVSRVEVPAPKPAPKKVPKVPALKPITPTKNDPTIIMDNEDGAAATIITDTKHGEFKLIPAIINSIRDWFLAKNQSRIELIIAGMSLNSPCLVSVMMVAAAPSSLSMMMVGSFFVGVIGLRAGTFGTFLGAGLGAGTSTLLTLVVRVSEARTGSLTICSAVSTTTGSAAALAL